MQNDLQKFPQIIQPNFSVTNDLDSLAAYMMALDIIVSIDNSSIVLAGALGKAQSYLLLPVVGAPLWGQGEGRSHWFPCVERLRKSAEGWLPTLQRLRQMI